jgi:hypothetical protein
MKPLRDAIADYLALRRSLGFKLRATAARTRLRRSGTLAGSGAPQKSGRDVSRMRPEH